MVRGTHDAAHEALVDRAGLGGSAARSAAAREACGASERSPSIKRSVGSKRRKTLLTHRGVRGREKNNNAVKAGGKKSERRAR